MASSRQKKSELSIVDMRALVWNASQGDEMARDILIGQNKKLAKIANQRLRALEKSGYDMFAYDRAITYLNNLGKSRFSTALPDLSVSSNYGSVRQQMQELINFVDASTSTVTGAKAYLTKKVDKISEYTGTTYTDRQKYQMGRLLGTDSVSTLLREVRGDSAEVIHMLEELSSTDFDKEQISLVINRYLQGYDPWGDNTDYMNYDEMMDALRELKDVYSRKDESIDDTYGL